MKFMRVRNALTIRIVIIMHIAALDISIYKRVIGNACQTSVWFMRILHTLIGVGSGNKSMIKCTYTERLEKGSVLLTRAPGVTKQTICGRDNAQNRLLVTVVICRAVHLLPILLGWPSYR